MMIVPGVIGVTEASQKPESLSEGWIAIELFGRRARDKQILRPVIASSGMPNAAKFPFTSRLVQPE